MPGSLLGNSVRRVEDPELLTGRGTYVGNLRVGGLTRAAFVRSPIAHGRLLSIDTSEAEAAPGVIAVFTAGDLGWSRSTASWFSIRPVPGRPLPTDKVRFVGEAVALVVAETEAAAIDAAELVVVEYDPLPAVADLESAVADGAPAQFEEIGSNVVAGTRGRGPENPLGRATTVVRARLENQRVAVMPMEGNAIAAIPGDGGEGPVMTVYVSTQMPHGFMGMASRNLGYEAGEMRVVAPHVGGGFGAKAGMGYEHAAVIAAARRLGRPVTWVETRSENLVAMPHGRGQVQWIDLGFDEEGRITGMHCRVLADAGAYAGFGGVLAIGPTQMMAQGVYNIPAIRYDVAVAVTNTTPMGAFRGAGRPEAAEFLERMMDLAAAELGLDPVELRRRNLLPAFESSFTTVMGTTYDTGDYRTRSGRSRAGGRIRRSSGRAAGQAECGRPVAARHRPGRVRRDHGGRRRSGIRLRGGPPRRDGDHKGGHVRSRPGSRHGFRHDRLRPARYPDGGHSIRSV